MKGSVQDYYVHMVFEKMGRSPDDQDSGPDDRIGSWADDGSCHRLLPPTEPHGSRMVPGWLKGSGCRWQKIRI